MSSPKPILLGCSGLILTDEERVFFIQNNPFGFILFARNCADPDQLRALTRALRETVGRPDAPIFIDQEGGRVARLKSPQWHDLPSLRVIGAMFENNPDEGREAMRLHAEIIAHMLRDVGINGNCAPVLDLFIEGASVAIGDRALSADPKIVAELAGIAIDAYLEGGVLPVIKHMPGHGRVKVDPHEVLPFVDTDRATLEAQDFAPFIALKNAPIAMNCHVVFRALDPDNPVSMSKKVHDEILRGAFGFEGLIFSDDLAMGALSGSPAERAQKALAAGADIVLYCTGKMPEMRAICADLPPITAAALARWEKTSKMGQ